MICPLSCFSVDFAACGGIKNLSHAKAAETAEMFKAEEWPYGLKCCRRSGLAKTGIFGQEKCLEHALWK
jgi:hypothetical protein